MADEQKRSIRRDVLKQTLMGAAAIAARRKTEALKMFRPMPTQMPFFESRAKVRIVRGGNRSGKTSSVAAEVASAAIGEPIIGFDDKPLPYKYPPGPLKIWVIGYDEKHIGQTIFRTLFQPQTFKVIRDLETNKWRPWCPWKPEDEERRAEARFAPPLIPPRMIDKKGWAWENRAERVFRVCRLINGTEIFAFSSKGEPKQGDSCDLIWIDEDVAHPQHVGEWLARLIDRSGRMVWSAMPHERNDALVQLSEEAAEQRGEERPLVEEIVLRMSNNPYLPQQERNDALRLMKTEEQRRRRDLGEFNTEATTVFPGFNETVHGLSLDEWNTKYKGGPDWCRYVSIDPGWQRLAVSFWAVSPPDVSPEMIVLEDELYLQHADATELARQVAKKIEGRCYEAFIIDDHGSRKTQEASGETISSQYERAFHVAGVFSVSTGSGFEKGSDNIKGRIESARGWLRLQGDCSPLMRVILDNTPNFQMEIRRYRWKKNGDMVLEEPDDRHFSHLMVTWQYFAAAMEQPGRTRWFRPPIAVKRPKSAAQLMLEEKQRKKKQQRRFINLGPEDTSNAYQFV